MVRPTDDRREGFTLVELTIAMLLVGILAVVAMPRYRDAWEWHCVESAARRVVADLEWARRQAIQTGTNQSAVFSVVDNRYKLVAPVKGPRELYDLRADRGETKDLIQQQPGVAKEMGGELRKWQESVLKSLTGADY